MILLGLLYTEKTFQTDYGWNWRIINMILLGLQPEEKNPVVSFVGCRGFLFLHFRIQTAFNASFEIKNPGAKRQGFFLCSGGRIRTSDLWVMSPTSYHCSTPQCGCKVNINLKTDKFIFIFSINVINLYNKDVRCINVIRK